MAASDAWRRVRSHQHKYQLLCCKSQHLTVRHAKTSYSVALCSYVEVQSGACSVCPLGQQNSLGPPYNVAGCGGGDVYVTTPGNVVVIAGLDITFTSCTFQHLGAYAAAVRPANSSQSFVI